MCKQKFLLKFKGATTPAIRKLKYEVAKHKSWFKDIEWIEPIGR
jgi:hypothetical protein